MANEERSSLFEELIDSVRPIFENFRPNPNINIANDSDDWHQYNCHIFWRLEDSKNKKRKSKIIKLNITENALEFMGEEHEQKKVFSDCIAAQLKKFDPDHNNIIDIEPPSEEWIIDFVRRTPSLSLKVLKDSDKMY